ncbi:Hachiman antiphage defense system protein HamA [Myroides odoratus]|uniref:Hachiman antiphage defense system protein HamA n=1 Tax=Myroides odoratus TaxID=256 RepID=UPI003340E0B6
MSINFGNLISINKKWLDKEFNHHYTKNINDKLKVRLYTIKPSGTVVNCNSLANALLNILPEYFKSKVEIEKEINQEIEKTIDDYTTATEIEHRELIAREIHYKTYREASKFFKTKTADSKSGKYGELLLFGIVEALLNCKMIAHKITNLTNYHDEVKGGDGIFMGEYELTNGTKNNAYLIGESKIWQNYSGAKKDALDSIDRFYSSETQANFNTLEFFIAKKDISKIVDTSKINIDELYNRLDLKSEEFKQQIAVHPILIMYDTKGYEKLMVKALNNIDLTDLINTHVQSNLKRTLESIKNKVKEYSELEKVYLDFILIPINSVETFNKTMDNLI